MDHLADTIRRAAATLLAAAWLAGAAFWSGCATVPPPAGSPAQDELRAATQHYGDLVGAMDHSAIAALFTPDGEIAAPGRAPITGREAIFKYLESFKDQQVESAKITADSIDVHGAYGHVIGHYWQRARLPSGRKVETRGAYAADWHREPDGKWYIRFMTTRSAR